MAIILSGSGASAGTRSLNTLLQELLERTSSGYASVTTGTGASQKEIVDAEIQDSYEPNNSYKGGFVRVLDAPNIDQTRRVGVYNNNTGTLTVGRNFGNTIGTGVNYLFSELLSFPQLIKCINMALAEGFFRDKAFLSPPTTEQVALPSWVTERGQVIDILYRISRSSNTNDFTYYPVSHWNWVDYAGTTPGQSAQVFYVSVDPIDPAADALVVEGIRPFPPLVNGSDVTSMDLEWLIAGAKFHFYEFLIRNAGKADIKRFEELRAAELSKWNTQLYARQPSDPSRLQFRFPFGRRGSVSQYPAWINA